MIRVSTRVSEGYIFKCTVDLALRTPCVYEHPAKINSRYYGISLLRKCGHFNAPLRDISPVFSLTVANTSSKILTHNIKQNKRKQRNHSSIGCEYENFLFAAGSFSGSRDHVRNFIFALLHIISYVSRQFFFLS